MTDADSFPEIIPGGSLLLAWQIRDRHVLLVGGGVVASGRLDNLLSADALITLIAPRAKLHPLVVHRIFNDATTKGRITYLDRTFAGEDDLVDVDMVMTAIDDVSISRDIYTLAHARHIPINCADMPPECDFYFGSQIRKGPLQVMVSTGGKGPKLANIIRRRMEDSLPDNVGDAIERVGALRAALRKRAPGVGGKLGQQRMDWMIGVCEAWSLDELGELDGEMTEFMLNEGWDKDRAVPTFKEALDQTGRRRFVMPDITHLLSPGFVLGAGAGVLLSLAGALCRRRR
ncbi:Bifunctional dehydrogenase and ferrochelatase [Tulasnella sp. JGI-2019a]|nr:Bifunctional dehydrogenase and ferrochelatase [Tulasnella sp. JGI-2019a]KAG9016975.1 Bifunctional dehydrogenase and ferrochelatase [Tulasnella sp. JGI-2019a]KAG9040127.1 Bifunctional dehydrogenase and ferrochelatase [Tulasnella sp. JGI-2019a]